MQVFFKRAIVEATSGISPRDENALEVGGLLRFVWLHFD